MFVVYLCSFSSHSLWRKNSFKFSQETLQKTWIVSGTNIRRKCIWITNVGNSIVLIESNRCHALTRKEHGANLSTPHGSGLRWCLSTLAFFHQCVVQVVLVFPRQHFYWRKKEWSQCEWIAQRGEMRRAPRDRWMELADWVVVVSSWM